MLSKPRTSKKRVLPPLNSKECYCCGSTQNLTQHEIFYGRNRLISIAYGIVIWLCFNHHRHLHDNPEQYEHIKEYGKQKFKEMYPDENFEEVFK